MTTPQCDLAPETELVRRTTFTQLVAAYQQSEADIREGLRLMKQAEDRLNEAFVIGNACKFDLSSIIRYENHYDLDPDKLIQNMKVKSWKVLIDRMELRRVLTKKRETELEEQLKDGKGLPEITEANILAMIDNTLSNVGVMVTEAVKEVFDYLRPQNGRFKTNDKCEVGRRVVLSYAIERKWRGGFDVRFHYQANIRGIDNVFHMLDGKGTVPTHRGPLTDAICGTSRENTTGETEYFRFKCFGNGNLHLEFKRADLLGKLNAVAGGATLKQPKAE